MKTTAKAILATSSNEPHLKMFLRLASFISDVRQAKMESFKFLPGVILLQ